MTSAKIDYRCQCGQAIAAPPSWAGRRARCPRCGVVATVPDESPTGDRPALAARDAEPDSLVGRVCAVCQTAVARGEAACICSACRAPYHRECWQEIGGCATYGCEHMPQAPKEELGAGERTTAWGDIKDCPRCHREIRASAVKCRFCRSTFPSAVPMTTREYLDWCAANKALRPTRQTAVFFFVISLLGVFAPVVLVGGGIWLFFSHQTLVKVGGAYRVLVYFALGLSVVYTLIMLLAGLT